MEVLSCGVNQNSNCRVNCQNNSGYFAVPALKCDVFQKSNYSSQMSFGKWPEIFSKVNGVSRESISKLSQPEFAHLKYVATQQIDPIFVDKVNRFSNIFEGALKAKYPNKNVVLVSIGQSPAMLSEMLNAKGMKTAICPISGLTELKNVKEILKNPGTKKYFEYMKKIGLAPENMNDASTQYVFVDYASTGNSIKRFEELLRSKVSGYSHLTNISFDSIQDVLNSYNPKNDGEKNLINEFVNQFFHKSILKKYSPIFKLPVERLGDVEQIRNSTPANQDLNQLKFLIATAS